MIVQMGANSTVRSRIRGRSPRGTRLTASAPFGSWGTQTLVAGLGASDLIAPWVIKGAMDGPAFAAYIREVLIPEIEPGTVVILDNLATHKNKEAEAALRAHGCWLLFLPPYSPDLNPVEMTFSKLKAHLRRIGARTFTGLFDALSEICDLYQSYAAGICTEIKTGNQGCMRPEINRRILRKAGGKSALRSPATDTSKIRARLPMTRKQPKTAS